MPVLTLYIEPTASDEDVLRTFDVFKATLPDASVECGYIDARGPHGQRVAIVAVPAYADVDLLCSLNLFEGLTLLSPLDDYDDVVAPTTLENQPC